MMHHLFSCMEICRTISWGIVSSVASSNNLPSSKLQKYFIDFTMIDSSNQDLNVENENVK